jgi:hypothetical protein
MVLQLNGNAFCILKPRYLKKDHEGIAAESPEEVFHPAANHIAAALDSIDPRRGRMGQVLTCGLNQLC